MRTRLLLGIALLICLATGAAAQEVSNPAPRVLTMSIVVLDSSSTGTVRRDRLQALAVAAADSLHVRLVPFDLASTSLLPDTLLVLVVRVSPDGTADDVTPNWLVTKDDFRPRTRFSHAPLRVTCGVGVSAGMNYSRGTEQMRAWIESHVADALQHTLACYRRET